jgi:hypothetical protein
MQMTDTKSNTVIECTPQEAAIIYQPITNSEAIISKAIVEYVRDNPNADQPSQSDSDFITSNETTGMPKYYVALRNVNGELAVYKTTIHPLRKGEYHYDFRRLKKLPKHAKTGLN